MGPRGLLAPGYGLLQTLHAVQTLHVVKHSSSQNAFSEKKIQTVKLEKKSIWINGRTKSEVQHK